MSPSRLQRRRIPSGGSLLRRFPEQRTTIRRKILWQSLLLAGFSVMVLSLLSSIVGLSLIRNRVLVQLSSTVASREDLLSRSLQYDRERTALLAAEAGVRRAFRSPAGAEGSPLLPLWERLRREQVPAEGMVLVSADGTVRDRAGMEFPSPISLPNATLLSPVLDRHGAWIATDAVSPVHAESGETAGALAVRYNPAALLALLADTAALGPTGELLLVRDRGGTASIVHAFSGEDARRSSGNVPVGDFVIPEAVKGMGGVFAGKDEWGAGILAAYRSVPAVGWGMVVKVDTRDALAGWERFSSTLLAIDLFLVALTAVFGVILSRQLSSPILDLAGKLKALQPGRWSFRRSVSSGDEVEFLDVVAEELTSRLRVAYVHLEDEVRDRTVELRKQFLLDRTILEHIEYGVFVTDARGGILDANPAAARLLQTTKEGLSGRKAEEALRFFRKQKPLLHGDHPVAQTLRKKARIRLFRGDQLTILAGKDMFLPVTLSVTPLTEKKRLYGALVILEDVREENRVDEMKSEFITLASHQLRTPLSSLRWYLQLLKEEGKPELSETQQSFLEEIDVGATRMVNLLDDLLRITRLEGGEIRAEKQACELRKLLQEASEEWKPIAAGQGMTFALALPPKPVRVSTDPALLHLVLQNLFTNATKYSPKGTHIGISLIPQKRSATLTVSDNGMGIPEEEQKHVFEKFFRARNAKRIDAGGSGLGLFLTRMIVENLGGHISFRSETGKGTTFTVKLPVH